MDVMYSESIMEAFIIHKKQINATVLVGLMNGGWRGIQILKQWDSARGAGKNYQRERERCKRILSATLTDFPEKHWWRNRGLLRFLSQKVWKNYKHRIRSRTFLRASLFNFQLVPFSVPAFIFEPIKMRQELALPSAIRRREKNCSHWANIHVGGSHQNLIRLVWCLGGCALVTGGIQSAKQNEPGVFLFESDCHRAADLFYKRQPTLKLIQRKHLHIVHRNTANSPRNMLKAMQASLPPARSNDCLPFLSAVAMVTQIYFYEKRNVI